MPDNSTPYAADRYEWYAPKGTGICLLQWQGPASHRYQHRQGFAKRFIIQPKSCQGIIFHGHLQLYN